MRRSLHSKTPDRDMLRAYALGTLPARETARVEAALEASSEWRTALDAVKAELALLDALPPVAPPEGLAGRTLAHMRDADAGVAGRRAVWKPAAAFVAIAVVAAAFLVTLVSSDLRQRETRISTLKHFGLAFKMYSGEDRQGLYPPAVWDDGWRPQMPEEYIGEDLAARLSGNYIYLSHAAETPEKARILGRVMSERAETPSDIEADGVRVYRTREAIERFFITDLRLPAGSVAAQSEVPIMIDTFDLVGPGPPRGCFVLYMDGHVAWHDYGSGGPVDALIDELLPLLRGE